MTSRSALIGFVSRRAGSVPPKHSASRDETNEKVTASIMPRDARMRRARRVFAWASVSAGAGIVSVPRSEVAGMRSYPRMRTTSSTRSASPSMSPRHGGTEQTRFLARVGHPETEVGENAPRVVGADIETGQAPGAAAAQGAGPLPRRFAAMHHEVTRLAATDLEHHPGRDLGAPQR